MMRKAANEKKSKRICYSVLIVPHYEGRARQFKVSRFAIYGVVAACVIILSAVGFVVAQNYSLRNTVAQYKGMSLDEVVRLQTAQLDAANEALTKSNQELDALKQYVGYLSKLDQQVRKTLGVANVNVTLASILEQRSTPTLTVNRGLAASAVQAEATAQEVQEDAEAREKNLIVLQDSADKYNTMVAQTPSVWPVYGLVTSYYGWRTNPFGGRGGEFHDGVDIAAPYGTAIRATADGKVTQSGWNGSYGIAVTVYHRDGIETLYGHMSRTAVRFGATVKKGQVIGYEGNTGRSSGAHLHYEVLVHGNSVNPTAYLD
jgi:murein DD-endopeptidase MepM/ murein hydrolase activator NlpD